MGNILRHFDDFVDQVLRAIPQPREEAHGVCCGTQRKKLASREKSTRPKTTVTFFVHRRESRSG